MMCTKNAEGNYVVSGKMLCFAIGVVVVSVLMSLFSMWQAAKLQVMMKCNRQRPIEIIVRQEGGFRPCPPAPEMQREEMPLAPPAQGHEDMPPMPPEGRK